MKDLNQFNKSKFTDSATSFEDFLHKNRIRTNNVLNNVLWYFVITGPTIALGIFFGAFSNVKYITCIIISLSVILLASIHKLLSGKFPSSIFTCLFALISMELIIIYMASSKISIYLTYFIVPFVSLLFIDKRIYHISCAINYVCVMLSVFHTAPYYAQVRNDYTSSLSWFINFMSGITIETIIMYITGTAISITTTRYLKKLYENQKLLFKNKQMMDEQLEILNSMTDIYSHINIINFNDETIVSLNSASKSIEKIAFEKQQHSEIDQQLSNQIIIDQTKNFLDFTNLTTLQQRMKKLKFITAEFLSTTTGWFRVQYISIEQNDDLIPVRLIYTIQDIDEEKQKEENLKRISNTDQLTRLFNRRAYEDSIKKYETQVIENDFVLFSIDVNGLKNVNDNLGHVAGDELLQGASFSMLAVLGHTGTVFRTGGDEFLITTRTQQNCEDLKNQLIKISKNWHGNIVDELSLSIGYAKASDYPRASIHELEKIADANMYRDKELYYLSKGIDRRSQQKAFSSICNSYTKILNINLNTDSYSIIRMNLNEKNEGFGYSDKISTWLHTFGMSGMVHPDDLENYYEKTDIEYLRNYFRENNNEFYLTYRRKIEGKYYKSLMQISKADDFSEENQNLYLFVKNIDY